jgi:hypothetical protein
MSEQNLPSKVVDFRNKGFEIVHIDVQLLIKKPALEHHAVGKILGLDQRSTPYLSILVNQSSRKRITVWIALPRAATYVGRRFLPRVEGAQYSYASS